MPKQSQTTLASQRSKSELYDEINKLASKIQRTPTGVKVGFEVSKDDYEKTGKTRDLVSGDAGLTVNNTGEIENVSGNVHVGTSKIGAGAGAQYDAQTGGVKADVSANAGLANMGVGIDTENASGHINVGVDAGALGFGAGVGGSEKSGLTMNVEANFSGFGVEVSHTAKGPLANTRTVTVTISAGPKSLAQHKTTVTQVVTTKNHPLGPDKVLTDQTTTSVYTFGELQHEKVTMSSLRPDGKMNRKVLKDVSTPAYTAAGETFTGVLDTVGGPGAMSRSYRDQISKDVMGRLSGYDELAPDKSMVDAIADDAMRANRKSLEDLTVSNATANAITNGIVNQLTTQIEKWEKKGHATPITKHDKARYDEAIKLELDKIEAQLQALAVARPALAKAQAEALALAIASPLSKAESQGKFSRNVESGTYVGASEEYSPEDFRSVAQNQAQLARNTQLLEARRAVTQKANYDKLMNQAKAGLSKTNLLDTKQAQTHRPETLQQRYEGLGMTAANARTAVSNTQQNLSEISGTVESGRYAGPSGEFSPEDFQTEDDIKSFMRTPAYRDRRDPVAVDRVKKGFESLVTRQEQATQAAYERVQTDIDQKNAVRAKVDDKATLSVDKTTKQRRAQATKKELGPPTLKQFNAQNQFVEEQGLLTKNSTANASLTATSNFSLSRERTDTLQAASSAQQNRMADREKSWSNLSDHGKIDAARGSRRGAGRSARSATPSGTNAYGERTTGEAGRLGRGGQLSSVGGQKAKANQKNRAANKDGSYSLDAEGNGAGDAGGTVICTELYHQSFLPLDVFIEDQRYGAWIEKNDPYVMIGYHFLAKPVVRLMQRSPLFTQVLYTMLAKPWATEMVVKQGGNGFGSVRGKILFSLGLPICRWIGKMLVPTKKLGVKMATV